MNYYLFFYNTKSGPYAEEQIRNMNEKGELPPDTKIRTEDSGDWIEFNTPGKSFPKIIPNYPPYQKKAKQEPLRSTGSLATIVTLFFFGIIALQIISLFLNSLLLTKYKLFYEASESTMDTTSIMQTLTTLVIADHVLALVNIIIAIIGSILFLIWFYKSIKNASTYTHTAYPYSPGLSVAYFFVPIVNIYMPYKAMKALYNTTETPASPSYKAGRGLFLLWWLPFIFAGILLNWSFASLECISITDKADSIKYIDRHIDSIYIIMFCFVLLLISASSLILLVRRISQKQNRWI